MSRQIGVQPLPVKRQASSFACVYWPKGRKKGRGLWGKVGRWNVLSFTGKQQYHLTQDWEWLAEVWWVGKRPGITSGSVFMRRWLAIHRSRCDLSSEDYEANVSRKLLRKVCVQRK